MDPTPRKLHTFLLQCKPEFFAIVKIISQDDSVKSQLWSSPSLRVRQLECFKPGLLEDIEPAWLSDFALFVQELESNFGYLRPHRKKPNPSLKLSICRESHKATKYFIKFTQLAGTRPLGAKLRSFGKAI